MSYVHRRVLPSGAIRFQARASTSAGGKRQHHTRSFATEREARAWANSQGALIERKGVAAGKDTVARYFERWLTHIEEAGQLEPKTVYEYRHHLRRLVPLIGAIRLNRLRSYDLDTAYGALLRRGGRGGRPLHPRTVSHVHRIVSGALKRAVKWKLIPENPAASAEPPSPGKSQAKAPSPAQLRAYLAAAHGTRYWPFILAALTTGLRRGELCGLSWRDVDLEHERITVTQVMAEVAGRYWLRAKPKSAAGHRTIAIPLLLADELWRLKQAQAEERKRYGSQYRDDLDLVFCLPGGDPWQPNRLSRKLAPIARAAGLPSEVRPLHGLRHDHATRMLSEGVPLKVASQRLGHSSITITGDTYTHVEEGPDRAAAAALDKALAPLLAEFGSHAGPQSRKLSEQ
jgi:integrase